MLRKPLAIAVAGIALATPSSAFAMHGLGEQTARVSRDLEVRGASARSLVAIAPTPAGSFSWLDAGIGASVTGGFVVMFAGGWRVITQRQRRVRPSQPAV